MDGSIEVEKQALLPDSTPRERQQPWKPSTIHLIVLYCVNVMLAFMVMVLTIEVRRKPADPTLGVYCKSHSSQIAVRSTNSVIAPANEAVEYIPQQRFRAALFNNTPYMGYPTDETDKLWSDLYNCMSHLSTYH